MSLVAHAVALLPAIAALIVVLAALWDERAMDVIDQLRSLDVELPHRGA